MSDRRRALGCFKNGCLGCMALIAVGVGLTFLIGAIQLTSDNEPDQQQRQAEQQLPAVAEAYANADLANAIDIQNDPNLAPAPPATATGTLIIDMSMGEFSIRPGPADEPLRIEADFDTNNFELEENFEPGEDGEWTYNVNFGGKGGFLGMLLRGAGNNPHNKVDIIVPRGHPMKLVGNFGMGETKLDLSGLWLEDVDLEFSMGDHFVEFREPTPYPIGRFDIDSSMGELELRGLGEASPELVKVSHSMGEMFLDLQGPWRRDATVRADFSMGECRVWLPENARVDMERARVTLGESYSDLPDYSDLPADAPVITLEASGGMGELRIEY